MNPRNRNIIIGIIVVVIVAIAAFIGFGQKSQANKTVNKTVKIGIMTGTKEDDSIWQTVSKTAKDKYGITLKFTHFTDYTQPNTALKNGDIDLNAFQHYAFLKAWNKANNGNLVAIGDTVISPISVYSKQLKNISDIKEGDASQTARALDSVDAAVINNNYAVTAGLKKSDAIFTEPVNKDSQQWINIIVANKKDENNTVYKDVVKAYETEATKKTIAKAYPDKSTIPAWGLKLK